MGIEDLINLALLALVIGVSTMIKGCRNLRAAQRLSAKVRRELEDCEQARHELQEFVVLFNCGATEEAYEHLTACGFKTIEPAAVPSCLGRRCSSRHEPLEKMEQAVERQFDRRCKQ